MDWAKAKSIMLIMLLALNLFLVTRITSYASISETPSATIKNTETILRTRNVVLECDIPRYQRDAAKLVLGDYDYDMNMLDKLAMVTDDNRVIYNSGEKSGKAAENAKATDEMAASLYNIQNGDQYTSLSTASSRVKSAEDYVRNTLTGSNLLSSSYVLDEARQNPDGSLELIFIEKFGDMLVFDNYAIVTVNNKKMEEYEAKRREIIGFSDEKLNDFAAAYQILLKNYGMDTDEAAIAKESMGDSTKPSAKNNAIESERDNSKPSAIDKLKDRLINSSGSALTAEGETGTSLSEDADLHQDNANLTIITDIDLGYKESREERHEYLSPQGAGSLEITQQPPVWRVKVKGDEKPRYFDATSGEELVWD
jgi:hypothetical protein